MCIYIYWIHNNCITNIHQFNQPDVRRRRLQVFSLGHQQLGTRLPCEASVESWLPNGHFVGKIESNNGLNIGSIWTYIYYIVYDNVFIVISGERGQISMGQENSCFMQVFTIFWWRFSAQQPNFGVSQRDSPVNPEWPSNLVAIPS